MKQRIRRKVKIKLKAKGKNDLPRLCVYRSLKYIEAQLIDDNQGKTIISVNSKKIEGKNKIDKSIKAGQEIAKKAKTKKINKVRFDRNGFAYHGQVKALAEGARTGGLKF